MAPKISVIVPVHNTSNYLRQCLDSIVNQTFREIELICIDDGSTDNSYEILRQYAKTDKRITILHREKASGSAALPRNMGLHKASSKYIIFLDSDDFFRLDMLELMYIRAEQYYADIVMCDNHIVDEDSFELTGKEGELHKKYLPDLQVFSYMDIKDHIFQISSASVWHKLILRDLITSNGLEYQLDTPILDDTYFVNALLVLAKRITILDKKLLYYRSLRPNAQTTYIAKYKKSIFKAFLALNNKLITIGKYDEVKSSLQRYALVTMDWWLHSISSYKDYSDLYHLYKNEYFEALGLKNVIFDNENDDAKGFYDSIMHSECRPSLKILVEELLPEKSNIAIYGAGKVGKMIYKVIEDYGKHRIVLWCDKNAENMNNPLINHPSSLVDFELNAVIIAIGNLDIVKEVKKYLIRLGIKEDIIFQV